jgi:hypothetical protein
VSIGYKNGSAVLPVCTPVFAGDTRRFCRPELFQLDAIEVYTAGDGSEEVEEANAVEIAVQASGAEQAAQMAFTATVAELSASHRATRAEVHELRRALDQSKDRTRRPRQQEPITRATMEVQQVRAANQRNGTAEREEDRATTL